jgi:hypothetical protein
MENNINSQQRIEQILRTAFADGIKSTAIIEKFHSDLDMYEQSRLSEEHFQKFLMENEKFISMLLWKQESV